MTYDSRPGINAVLEQKTAMERQLRHMLAAQRSDYLHLKECLLQAAQRFADLADTIEKDRSYDPVSFMRASAERYRAEAEAH